jgi:uncharacterized protein (DUF488 family)
MAFEPLSVLTIGHSTHSLERFLALLHHAGVTALADVRTAPFSRHFPHFNQDKLKESLQQANISYVSLGKELGGRPRDRRYYCDGIADYEKMATAKPFMEGLQRVLEGASRYRIALMCSEQNPLDCHRCLLVGRALAERDAAVSHILANGSLATHAGIEEKLLALSGREFDDFFSPKSERLSAAYRDQSKKVAFSESNQVSKNPAAAE